MSDTAPCKSPVRCKRASCNAVVKLHIGERTVMMVCDFGHVYEMRAVSIYMDEPLPWYEGEEPIGL